MALIFWFVFLFVGTEFVTCMTEAQIQATRKLVRRSCKSKLKITNEDELNGILDGKWENLSGPTKVQKDGYIDYESSMKIAATLIPERRAATETMIENCKDAGSELTDKCEIAYEICKCFYFDNSKYYVIP